METEVDSGDGDGGGVDPGPRDFEVKADVGDEADRDPEAGPRAPAVLERGSSLETFAGIDDFLVEEEGVAGIEPQEEGDAAPAIEGTQAQRSARALLTDLSELDLPAEEDFACQAEVRCIDPAQTKPDRRLVATKERRVEFEQGGPTTWQPKLYLDGLPRIASLESKSPHEGLRTSTYDVEGVGTWQSSREAGSSATSTLACARFVLCCQRRTTHEESTKQGQMAHKTPAQTSHVGALKSTQRSQ